MSSVLIASTGSDDISKLSETKLRQSLARGDFVDSSELLLASSLLEAFEQQRHFEQRCLDADKSAALDAKEAAAEANRIASASARATEAAASAAATAASSARRANTIATIAVMIAAIGAKDAIISIIITLLDLVRP